MTYLLRLPLRMAQAALGVVVADLDRALCLSAASEDVERMALSFASLKEFRPC